MACYVFTFHVKRYSFAARNFSAGKILFGYKEPAFDQDIGITLKRIFRAADSEIDRAVCPGRTLDGKSLLLRRARVNRSPSG